MSTTLALPSVHLPSVSAVALLLLRVADILGPGHPASVACPVPTAVEPVVNDFPWRVALAQCEARLSDQAVCGLEDRSEAETVRDFPVWSVLAALVLGKLLVTLVWCCFRHGSGAQQQRDREEKGVGQGWSPTHAPTRARMLGNGVLE